MLPEQRLELRQVSRAAEFVVLVAAAAIGVAEVFEARGAGGEDSGRDDARLRPQLVRSAERGCTGEEDRDRSATQQREQHLGLLRLRALQVVALVTHHCAESMQLASGTSGARTCIGVNQHARVRRDRILARIDHLHLAGARLLGQPAQELGAPVVLDAGRADDERRPLLRVCQQRDGSDGLAQPHVVSDEAAHLVGDEELYSHTLVRQQARLERGWQRECWWRRRRPGSRRW
mmetsp:Transcript_8990/g.22301  ORF Transcript_8990/g.22301 Transcript_8990/m.22301 type:complete len:233 (-) Transcript_8990:134-832(-)